MPELGKKPVAGVSDKGISRLLKAVAKARSYQARHLLAYLSKFYRWAAAQRFYGLTKSPLDVLSAKELFGKPSPRAHILKHNEIAPCGRRRLASLIRPPRSFVFCF